MLTHSVFGFGTGNCNFRIVKSMRCSRLHLVTSSLSDDIKSCAKISILSTFKDVLMGIPRRDLLGMTVVVIEAAGF